MNTDETYEESIREIPGFGMFNSQSQKTKIIQGRKIHDPIYSFISFPIKIWTIIDNPIF